jgi:hypothetical protein
MLVRMKLQVPFRMPVTRVMRSPARPSRSAASMGMPPATEASKSSRTPRRSARASRSAPCAAMSCLFAVTTERPLSSARATHAPAGSSPPTTSTTMSTGAAKISSMSDVHVTSPGTQSTRLRATSRLKMWVRRTPRGGCSVRMRAAARPTVPNPSSATRQDGSGGAVSSREGLGMANSALSAVGPVRVKFMDITFA